MLKRRFSVQWLMTCHPLLRVEPSWLYWNISLSPEKMYGPWQKNCGRHLGDFKFQIMEVQFRAKYFIFIKVWAGTPHFFNGQIEAPNWTSEPTSFIYRKIRRSYLETIILRDRICKSVKFQLNLKLIWASKYSIFPARKSLQNSNNTLNMLTTPTNKTHYDLDASYVNEEATPAPSGVLRSVHWHTRCGVKGRRIMDNRESNGGEGGQRLETQNKYGLGGVPPWIRDVGGYQNTSVLRVLLR
ncbi:hypothetical protein B0H13DRAFT_1888432 [Mycena leptocephala]|nr:hypothetical protein B0H13DRAFT_1888432 [Mycena leptocephala]